MDNNINYIAFDFVEGNNNEILPENVEVEILALEEEIIIDPEAGMNNIKLGSDTIKNMYMGDSRIIQMYLNGQPLM